MTQGRLRAVALLLACLGLVGCATDARLAPRTEEANREKAAFYWPYAALAADVYRTGGESDALIAMALSSPWLQATVAASGDAAAAARLRSLGYREAEESFRHTLRTRCKQAPPVTGSDPDLITAQCQAVLDALEFDRAARAAAAEEPNRFEPDEPRDKDDCKVGRGIEPRVPVARVAQFGWERVPELQKQIAVKGWRIFVPDLAIDVWRRVRSKPGEALVMEYAIVYRGTVGSGGWFSNLRGLTAATPFVWDQYRQAREATAAIVGQIERLHLLADDVLRLAPPTRLLFTTVGHSLGGGLAQYIYLKNRRITRVVGFDPSPVNGTSLIGVEQRPAVTANGKREVDEDPREPKAAIHLLFEDGEILSLVAPCHSGPVWGAEGGPAVRCDTVDFSRGNVFRQHNMAQLACKLFLVSEGRPPR